MPGLTMVRSWHTRDFLFVILAFLFVFVRPIYNFNSIDPYNAMPSNALELTPYEQSLNDNLEFGGSPQYRSHPGGIDPYNAIPSNALQLTPYEQSLNDNLELGGSLQYRSHPGAGDPYNAMLSNALELTPHEQTLNDNLELGRSPQYGVHPGGVDPYNAMPSNALQLSPYQLSLNDNLEPGVSLQYRGYHGGDHTVNASPESTFSHIMYPPAVHYDANYRRPYVRYIRRPRCCYQPLNRGKHCYFRIARWYYNKELNKCLMFIYKGCGGNNNNFHTKKECERACKAAPFLSHDAWGHHHWAHPHWFMGREPGDPFSGKWWED